MKINEKVNVGINASSINDVHKVTPKIVQEAVKNLNTGKTDPIYDFTSDCLINGPEALFKHLSNVIKAFLVHGHVSTILLLY